MQNPKAIRNKLAYFYSGQPHHKFVSFLFRYDSILDTDAIKTNALP